MAAHVDPLYRSHPELPLDESSTEFFSDRLQLRQPGLLELRKRQVNLPSAVFSIIPDDLPPTQSVPQTTNPPQKSSRVGDDDEDDDDSNTPRKTKDEKGDTRPTRTADNDVIEPTRGAQSTANQDSKKNDKASPKSQDPEVKTSKSGGQTDSPKAASSTMTPPRTTTDSSTSETPTTESSTDSPTPITSTTPSSTETPSSLASRSVTSVEAITVTSTSFSSSQSSSTTPNSIVASNSPSSTSISASASSPKTPISKTGVIVASVSATAVLIGIILLIVFCVRRKKQKRLRVIAKNVNDEMYLEKQLKENSVGRIRKNTNGLGVIEWNPEPSTTLNRAYVSPPAAPWQPSTEAQQVIPSPVAMHMPSTAPWHAPTTGEQAIVPSSVPIHPPGGYTRPPRTSRLRSSSVRTSEVDAHQRPLSHQGLESDQNIEDIRRSNSLPPRASYHSSQSIPPPSIQPPSPHHQPQPAPQQSYQAYRPFGSRYQVPNTIPEEDPRGGNQQPPPGGLRTYLPGERTRSPQIGNELPASLVAGKGI